MKPEETALLLIEFQKDMVRREDLKLMIEKTKILENVVKLAKACREKGIPCIHIPIEFSEGYPELRTAKGFLTGIGDAKLLLKGTDGSEIIDELKEAITIRVDGKRRLSAFYNTNLDIVLRSLGTKTLIVTGFITNWCVEQTARDAFDRDYDIIVPVDCCAALSEEEQRFACEKIFPAIGEAPKTEDLIKRIK